jgi:hypothetical protein
MGSPVTVTRRRGVPTLGLVEATMRRFGLAISTGGVFVVLGTLLGACGSGISQGAPCDSQGEQACEDNKEFSCVDGKWDVAEDCSASGTTCVVKSGGDADCE